MTAQTQILGRLANEVELKFANETAIANFNIAVSSKFKHNGEIKEEVSFLPIVAFGKTAQTLQQYTKKGDLIFINGRIKQERWEQDGNKKSTLKIIVENFKFLPKNQEREANVKQEALKPQKAQKEAKVAEITDEELPF